MHAAIAAYAKAGNNLVVDYIMYEPEWLQDLLEQLQGCPVYLIGVHVPLNVLQAREQARSTSPIGHAGSHYYTVHRGNQYDFEFNYVDMSADVGAQNILNFVASHKK
ncbi:MAG: phosphotransferase-like protein [Candidatus Chromulinivorax sp.]